MTGTYHAKHQRPNGDPAQGELTFTVNTENQVIRDTAGKVVFQGPLTVSLVAGEATVSLPASDDGTLEPVGFTFTVTEKLKHVSASAYRAVEFQILDGQTVESADLASTGEVAQDPSYGANLNGALTQIAALRGLSDEAFAARLTTAIAGQIDAAAGVNLTRAGSFEDAVAAMEPASDPVTTDPSSNYPLRGGGKIVLDPGTVYTLSGPVTIPHRTIIEGNGAVIVATDPLRDGHGSRVGVERRHGGAPVEYVKFTPAS